MKLFRSLFPYAAILLTVVLMQACKAKKVLPKAAPVAEITHPPVEEKKPAPAAEAPKPEPAPAPVEKPNYTFSNIQFEFNSGILKTDSYPIMDKAALEMKKDPSVKFVLNGNSSAEGSDAHNMSLSIERANAVKVYLVNTGVSADNLTVKGYGESKPIADNSTEAGRVRNRRVEIQKLD
jgi:OOP family OmpA-OmpF porin